MRLFDRGLFVAVAALMTSGTVAAVPVTVAYRGQIVEGAAPPTIDVAARLYDQQSGGSPIWEQAAEVITVVDGVFEFLLGTPAPINSSTLYGLNGVWLELEVDGVTLQPRQSVHAVPYALVAREAEALGGQDAATYQSRITDLESAVAELQAAVESLQSSCSCAAAPAPPEGMTYVPPGTFWMGCNQALDSDCAADEYPQHQVFVSAFFVDVLEVTVAEYAACVQSGSCPAPTITESLCNWGKSGKGLHPINCVDWASADAYCEWAGKRLPTEAEWEKAARGGCEVGAPGVCANAMRLYPWGAGGLSCGFAVMDEGSGYGCGAGGTQPVGSRPNGASPYGALDMAGNVYEWVDDWYSLYEPGYAVDPGGPISGSNRIFRGGAYFSNAAVNLRTSFRDEFPPETRGAHVGFRCAKSP